MRIVTIACVIATATSCAALRTNGTTQHITVTSTLSDAEVFLDGRPIGATPAQVVLSRRSRDPVIRVRKDGFVARWERLQRTTSWWFLAALGAGGAVIFSSFLPTAEHGSLPAAAHRRPGRRRRAGSRGLIPETTTSFQAEIGDRLPETGHHLLAPAGLPCGNGSACASGQEGQTMRITILRAVAFAAGVLSTAGCATLFNGFSQRIEVTSEPPGAELFVGGELAGTTPTEVVVSRRASEREFRVVDGRGTRSTGGCAPA